MTISIPIRNYFLDTSVMNEEVKVWSQMFFDDGSVTEGRYISCDIYDDKEAITDLCKKFMKDTNRREGVLFIWGAGRVFARRCTLFLSRRGASKGIETLRFTHL